jgi:peroxisomal membrane protein 2
MTRLSWILSRTNESSPPRNRNERLPLCEVDVDADDGHQTEKDNQKENLLESYGTIAVAVVGDGDDSSSLGDYEPIDYREEYSSRTLGIASAGWRRYNDALERRPLLVKSVTALIILGSGDLCGQGLERILGTASGAGGGGVDWPRAGRFGMFGLVGAPWAHYFYYYLDRFLPPTEKPFTRTTLLKVCIDQGIQAPILLALMISTISLLKGTGWSGVLEDLGRNYWTALLANWKLWLPFSFINMAFVKPNLRVLFLNVVFFGWTIILSMMINK